jgi:hypothetical protein
MDRKRDQRGDENPDAGHGTRPERLCDTEELPRRECTGNREHARQSPIAVPHCPEYDWDSGDRKEDALRQIRDARLPRGPWPGRARLRHDGDRGLRR